jgi:hypothetical protein
LFFVTLFSLLFSLGVRAFLFRKDNPPLAFVLVALGIFCALFGYALQVISAVSFTLLPEWCLPLAKLLLYQGFLLFPHHRHRRLFDCHVFFGLPNRQNFPESLCLPTGWFLRASFAMLCGSITLARFFMEAMGDTRWRDGLRATAISVHLLRKVPFYQSRAWWRVVGSWFAYRAAFHSYGVCLNNDLARIYLFPFTSSFHGYSLVTLIVSSRLVLGHSGQSAKFRATLWL